MAERKFHYAPQAALPEDVPGSRRVTFLAELIEDTTVLGSDAKTPIALEPLERGVLPFCADCPVTKGEHPQLSACTGMRSGGRGEVEQLGTKVIVRRMAMATVTAADRTKYLRGRPEKLGLSTTRFPIHEMDPRLPCGGKQKVMLTSPDKSQTQTIFEKVRLPGRAKRKKK